MCVCLSGFSPRTRSAPDGGTREFAHGCSNLQLIAALANSKAKAHEVKKALKTAQETEKRISRAGDLYRPLAARGSQIYFCIAALSEL